MVHPTTAKIWKAMEEGHIPPDEMYGYLRLFVANEYDRDSSIADRLLEVLNEVVESYKKDWCV